MRIVLCGSVRFRLWFELIQEVLQIKGYTVDSLSLWGTGLYGYIDDNNESKPILEESHRQKIELADAIYVVDVHHYIGKSTQIEIDYAYRSAQRKVFFFSRNDLDVKSAIIRAVTEA